MLILRALVSGYERPKVFEHEAVLHLLLSVVRLRPSAGTDGQSMAHIAVCVGSREAVDRLIEQMKAAGST